MSERISIAALRAQALLPGTINVAIYPGQVLALIDAVEAAREWHLIPVNDPEDDCHLCRALARFSFGDEPEPGYITEGGPN